MSDTQKRIARLALGKVMRSFDPGSEAPDPYMEGNDRRYLGESDYGTLFAPKADAEGWWEPFDIRKPGHLAAWNRTRRDGRIAFLDFEGPTHE